MLLFFVWYIHTVNVRENVTGAAVATVVGQIVAGIMSVAATIVFMVILNKKVISKKWYIGKVVNII